MDGPHDLGGVDGFGPVVDDADRGDEWGLRVFALAGAATMAGSFGTPRFRHALERIEPELYLKASYYERWTIAIASLLTELGLTTRDELEAAAGGPFPVSGPVLAPDLDDPGPDATDAAFAVGDAVRVRDDRPVGHTRCPGYVRDRRGTIVRYDGLCNFDDVEAHSSGKRVEPLYSVRFTALELWGDAAERRALVHVDLFESYLVAA